MCLHLKWLPIVVFLVRGQKQAHSQQNWWDISATKHGSDIYFKQNWSQWCILTDTHCLIDFAHTHTPTYHNPYNHNTIITEMCASSSMTRMTFMGQDKQHYPSSLLCLIFLCQTFRQSFLGIKTHSLVLITLNVFRCVLGNQCVPFL